MTALSFFPCYAPSCEQRTPFSRKFRFDTLLSEVTKKRAEDVDMCGAKRDICEAGSGVTNGTQKPETLYSEEILKRSLEVPGHPALKDIFCSML